MREKWPRFHFFFFSQGRPVYGKEHCQNFSGADALANWGPDRRLFRLKDLRRPI